MKLIQNSVVFTSVAMFLFSAMTMPYSAGVAREARVAQLADAALAIDSDLDGDLNGDGFVDVLDIQSVAGAPSDPIPTEPDSEGDTPAAPAQTQPNVVHSLAVAFSAMDLASASNDVETFSTLDSDAVPASALYWRYCRVPHGPPLSALS